MEKIRVIKREKEIEGQVFEGKVTKFGTSAHISFSKKHLGKKVKIIVPSEAEYIWILGKEELNDFVKSCSKSLKKLPKHMHLDKKQAIKNILEGEFLEEYLHHALEILEKSKEKKDKELVEKIKSVYGIRKKKKEGEAGKEIERGKELHHKRGWWDGGVG